MKLLFGNFNNFVVRTSFDFSYLMYWKKQGRGIENWDFPIPFSYTGENNGAP